MKISMNEEEKLRKGSWLKMRAFSFMIIVCFSFMIYWYLQSERLIICTRHNGERTANKCCLWTQHDFPTYLVYKSCSQQYLEDTRKAFEDFRNKKKSVWSNNIWYVKYVNYESVFNILYIEIKHKCWKNFLQIN